MMDVIEQSSVVAARIRGGEPTADELLKKRARLLAMHDASEGRILAQQAHAGMTHHQDQETGLPFREPELDDGFDAFVGDHKPPRRRHDRSVQELFGEMRICGSASTTAAASTTAE